MNGLIYICMYVKRNDVLRFTQAWTHQGLTQKRPWVEIRSVCPDRQEHKIGGGSRDRTRDSE